MLFHIYAKNAQCFTLRHFLLYCDQECTLYVGNARINDRCILGAACSNEVKYTQSHALGQTSFLYAEHHHERTDVEISYRFVWRRGHDRLQFHQARSKITPRGEGER